MPEQPVCSNEKGVVLTVGIVDGPNRMACVMPIATNSTVLNPSNLCTDAVNSFQASVAPQFANCFSLDAYISFIAAEGMQDGRVPARLDLGSTAFPGTRPAGTIPDSCAGLLVFYEDPADIVAPARMRVGKTFIPAISSSDYDSTYVDPAWIPIALSLGNILANGYPSVLDTGSNWYRVISAPKPRATVANCKRVIGYDARGYIGTQRRRLLPH